MEINNECLFGLVLFKYIEPLLDLVQRRFSSEFPKKTVLSSLCTIREEERKEWKSRKVEGKERK